MRPRILVTQPIAERALQKLEAVADVAWNRDGSRVLPRTELLRAVADIEYLFCLLHDEVDAEVINAAPRLRMIASMGTGVGIDVAAATARRIPVTRGAGVVTEATADLAWTILMAVTRRMVEGDRLVRSGTFPGSQSNYLAGRGVFGKTLGLIGAGRVGQAVARRARGFGMTVLYHDPQRLRADEESALGLVHAPMDRVLAEADFVSVHAAYSPETYHLIGVAELARMKPTAYLVNTSRGPVVDEQALVAALRAGRIAGAALDVHEHEPRVNAELIAMSNVVLTPHLGSAVAELREEMALFVVDNILAFMEGRRPDNCMNATVFE